MSARTLFLAWREPESRRSYPIGRLDADGDPESYRFRYTRGALRAEREAGLPRTIEFPCADKEYRSSGLFPMFGNRVISPRRPDRAEQLRELGLGENADPIEILSANEGLRVTDAYRVFPKLVKKDGGEFACRFFLHGWRRIPTEDRERVGALEEGEELRVRIETENPGAGRDAGLVTGDLRTVGWAPRWLAEEAAAALRETGDCAARIVRINPLPPPSPQRILVEMRGCWRDHEPMSGEDFIPLVGD